MSKSVNIHERCLPSCGRESIFVFLVELSKNVHALVTISRKECSFRKLNHHRLCVSRLFRKTSCKDWGFPRNLRISVPDPGWARRPCIDCVWLHGTFSDFCDFSHGGYHCVTGYQMSDQSNTKLTAPPVMIRTLVLDKCTTVRCATWRQFL